MEPARKLDHPRIWDRPSSGAPKPPQPERINRNAFWVKVDGRFTRGRSRQAQSVFPSPLRRRCGSSLGWTEFSVPADEGASSGWMDTPHAQSLSTW